MVLPKSNLVLSGAGTLAGLHVGAVNYLWQHTRPASLVGTSAGSIVSACLATGMSPGEMKDVVTTADYAKLIPMNKFLAIFRKYLASNRNVRAWLLELTKGQKMADCVIPFTAITSDLVLGHTVTLNAVKNPDMLVADAVLASMSVPDVFPAFQNRYVDGGLACNLGVQYLSSAHKRLGLRVSEAQATGPITGFIDEQERIVSMGLSGSEHDEMLLAKAYEVPVISLPGGNLGFLNRAMTNSQKLSLYEAGYSTTQQWAGTATGKKWIGTN